MGRLLFGNGAISVGAVEVEVDGDNNPSGLGVYESPEGDACEGFCGFALLTAYPNGRTFNGRDFISRSKAASDFASACAMRASSCSSPVDDPSALILPIAPETMHAVWSSTKKVEKSRTSRGNTWQSHCFVAQKRGNLAVVMIGRLKWLVLNTEF